MRYLLDTDHLSVLQRQTGDAYLNLSTRMAQFKRYDFAFSVVSFHEQVIGIHAAMNQSKPNVLLKGYERMVSLLQDCERFSVLPFNSASFEVLRNLQAQKVGVAPMDLRIASIALSQDLVLLARNTKDFVKVPDLKFEDWTIAP